MLMSANTSCIAIWHRIWPRIASQQAEIELLIDSQLVYALSRTRHTIPGGLGDLARIDWLPECVNMSCTWSVSVSMKWIGLWGPTVVT